MTDMTAFERQLSGEIAGLMGPVRPVDDLAVFDAVIAAKRQKGWGFTMFSALKFVAAAAIVALFGGVLLTGLLAAPQGDEVAPAAVTESPSSGSGEATSFEGTVSVKAPDKVPLLPGKVESIPAEGKTLMQRMRGVSWEQTLEDVSDARLAGTLRTAINQDVYMQGPTSRVWTAAVRIDNAAGSWLGHLTGYYGAEIPFDESQQGILTGTGAYEGLTALVFFDTPRTGDSRVHGLIFSGDLPEAPDYPEPAAE